MTVTPDLDSLIAQAQAWIDGDVDDADKAELTALITCAQALCDCPDTADAHGDAHGDVEAARAELADRFAGSLQFGTAGLRGRMAAGPNRMCRAVVCRAAAGLGAYLLEALAGQENPAQRQPEPAHRQPQVVIGYDGRHRSRVFAEDSAGILTALGLQVHLMPRMLPTPLLAYVLQDRGWDAGIMVTASHNPAADNGYKVYLGGRVVSGWGQGAQIVPPYDGAIAAHIAQVGPANLIPRASSGWHTMCDRVVNDYLANLRQLHDGIDRDLVVVTTAMHGVGGELLSRMLADAGFTHRVHTVSAQYSPNPDFPTVAFPNPEEPGAMDLAMGLASQVGADVVIANDPDADRCAMATFDPRVGAGGGWRMLHGDELGAILGTQIAARLAESAAYAGAMAADDGSAAQAQASAPASAPPAFANSIVSSRLLSRIAARYGLSHSVTLTGFKWIARVPGLVFGYEEALGYCVNPAQVRDKDGISAALMIAQLVNRLKAEGRTVIDFLDDLARQHGLYLTDQLSLRFTDLGDIPATMARLRAHPPASLVGSDVVEYADLGDGYLGLPPTDGVLIRATDDTRVIVRPSGTEPKVKCYLEVIHPVEFDASFDKVTQARASARVVMDQLKDELRAVLQP